MENLFSLRDTFYLRVSHKQIHSIYNCQLNNNNFFKVITGLIDLLNTFSLLRCLLLIFNQTIFNRNNKFLITRFQCGSRCQSAVFFLGDAVVLKSIEVEGFSSGPMLHQGFIHHISRETDELLIKFHDQLHRNFNENSRFEASFTYSRTPFRRCHLAVKVRKLP